MKQIFYFILALSAFACSKQNPQVVMKTDLGDMTFEIYPEQAPITAANFLEYVDNDLFKGAHFYRVVTLENQPNDSIRIEVVQGGLGWNENEQRLPAIAHETTAKSGILHEDGVISMARGNPGTADSEFLFASALNLSWILVAGAIRMDKVLPHLAVLSKVWMSCEKFSSNRKKGRC